MKSKLPLRVSWTGKLHKADNRAVRKLTFDTNSEDAAKEIIEAYVAVQRQKGWILDENEVSITSNS